MRSILAFLLLAAPVLATDPPTEPRKYLNWWYKQLEWKEGREVDVRDLGAWDWPFKQLESKKLEDRQAAVKFLRDVTELSVADTVAGNAPYNPRFEVYGVPPDSKQGHTLALMWRWQTVHNYMPTGDKHPEFLPLIAWYLESEPDTSLQRKAAELLDTFTTADADKLRLKFASSGHANAGAVAQVLKQIPKHKQKLPADELLALCQHHRKQIREAAREVNNAQGGKGPGKFDPALAMQSPLMKVNLAELQKWTPDVLPTKDAELVEMTVRHLDVGKKEHERKTYLGWLIEKKGDTMKLLLPSGYTDEFTHGKKGSIQVNGTSDTPVTCDVSTRPAKIQTLVDAIAAERKKAGQEKENEFASPELRRAVIFAGGWLVQAGHTTEAAEVLLPAFDAHDADQHLLETARQEISAIVGERMYHTFTNSHDYTEVLKLSRHIDRIYRDTEYHPLASRFLEELPKRLDDFKTFTLPTPDEWEKQKVKLSRDEQIDYLTSRLRLLRLGPYMELTHVPPSQEQFADQERKTSVINPYSELMGDGWSLQNEKLKSEGLKLTLKDVPALSKHLKDDWLTLHYDPLGHFSLEGSNSTRTLVAEIINRVADHSLCTSEFLRKKAWDELTPKDIDAGIERINRWAKAHETMTEIDLQWHLYLNALKENLQEFENGIYGRVERRMNHLLSDQALSKERRADILAEMKRRYEKKEAGWERMYMLELYLAHDPKSGLKFAENELARKDATFVLAARIVFETGDKVKARTALGEYLATDKLDGGYWVDAMQFLLKDDTKESRTEALKLFQNQQLAHTNNLRRLNVLRLCLRAGMTEPYRFYRTQLDNAKDAEYFAGEIVRGPIGGGIAPDDPDVKKIVADHPQAADQIPHLKKWLDGKLKK